MQKLTAMVVANITAIIQIYEPLKVQLSKNDLVNLSQLKRCRYILTRRKRIKKKIHVH